MPRITHQSLLTSEFITHEPCPKCGSRDNLGRYDDGHGYCFGCGYVEFPDAGRLLPRITESVKSADHGYLLADAQPAIGVKGWVWLAKYGIRRSEVEGWLWSEERQWLIFPLLTEDGIIKVWQARNFSETRPKPKTLTFGPVSETLHILGTGGTVVVVEDIISATKVGRQTASVPIFGSNVQLKLLTRLRGLYENIVIWLDKDMAQKSLQASRRASQLGFKSARSVITDKDPKEYSDEDIAAKLA